jgi:DNA polymerase (family 10)
VDNKYYAQILSDVALLLQIKGANRYKIRAYQNASRAIGGLNEPVEDVLARGELTDIDGVGKSIAGDIDEIKKTGTCQARTDLLDELDPGLLELLKIQGMGAKKVKTLYDELDIKNIQDLKEAAENQKIRELDGFGKKTEEKFLAEIERLESDDGRTPLPSALVLAESFRDELAERDDVERIEIAGSIRRQKETIGDIDLLVASTSDPTPIMDAFTKIAGVSEILVKGDKKTSVRTVQGIQIDLRIVAPEVFGSALHYFTGSKEHHVKLRTRAKRQGMKISEYGVFKDGDPNPIASMTEEEVFSALGLKYIPPELREGFDEIDLALEDDLPELVDMKHIRGDIHMHTIESDGEATILEMAQAAKALGYEYIVLTDHSQVLTVANGMTPKRFARHIEAIREANEQIEDFTILAGIEVDILKDGSLDMDEELLRECDWVVGSVHIHQQLDKDAMTRRLLNAIDTGLLSCLGHPTGRILGGRPGYEYDLEEVLQACKAKRVAVEINGSTGRLDFNADHAARAHRVGVKIVLGSDAHSTLGLEAMPFAVGQARRAGLTPRDVLNCLPAKELVASVR